MSNTDRITTVNAQRSLFNVRSCWIQVLWSTCFWQDKAKQATIQFHTPTSHQTLMLCCQTHTSFHCPLMVLGLQMLTSGRKVHCVRFTAWFSPGLADTLKVAPRNSGSKRGVRKKRCMTEEVKGGEVRPKSLTWFSYLKSQMFLNFNQRQFWLWFENWESTHTHSGGI